MADPTEEKRAKIPLKRFLGDYKSGVPDREIMQKYDLSARSLISLIKTLMDKKVLNADDLIRRKQMTEQIELVKEQQFLKGLFICTNCGHPHPQAFDICPACEAKQTDYTSSDGVVEDVTTTGGHFYVDDTTTVVEQVELREDDLCTEQHQASAGDSPEPMIASKDEPPAPPSSETPAALSEPVEDKPMLDEASRNKDEQEGKDKASPFKSVRALISRIRKT